jgi:transcriptional regulatory protein LevR
MFPIIKDLLNNSNNINNNSNSNNLNNKTTSNNLYWYLCIMNNKNVIKRVNLFIKQQNELLLTLYSEIKN